MANVTFRNAMDSKISLHMRVGAVDVPADHRGSANTDLQPGESSEISVGDGDVFYCYGRQPVSNDENPPLCNAKGGATVALTADKPCFVPN